MSNLASNLTIVLCLISPLNRTKKSIGRSINHNFKHRGRSLPGCTPRYLNLQIRLNLVALALRVCYLTGNVKRVTDSDSLTFFFTAWRMIRLTRLIILEEDRFHCSSQGRRLWPKSYVCMIVRRSRSHFKFCVLTCSLQIPATLMFTNGYFTVLCFNMNKNFSCSIFWWWKTCI